MSERQDKNLKEAKILLLKGIKDQEKQLLIKSNKLSSDNLDLRDKLKQEIKDESKNTMVEIKKINKLIDVTKNQAEDDLDDVK